MSTEAQDFENMSDEDIMNLVSPGPMAVEEPAVGEEEDQSDVAAYADVGDVEAAPEETAEADVGVAGDPNADHTTPQQSEAFEGQSEDPASQAEATGSEGTSTNSSAAQAPSQTLSPEEAYKQIMAPFKANGKEFTPSSPEEVIRLMQMGANYTKKMQALQPNLKLMRMLDNNGLLDESKLSFLIDLSRKDQGAIKKLLADSKIDPLDLDMSEAPAYRPGNHSVSDQELAFSETLSDVMASDEGKETVRLINSNWDAASKEAIYREPAILQILTEQRANGIYDRISAEIDRQRMLGGLTNVPFIQAYKMVGDALHSQGKLVPNQVSAQPNSQIVPQQARVLETRTAAPKSPVKNDAAARAASPARIAGKPPAKAFDPFSMTDEEILALSSPGSR